MLVLLSKNMDQLQEYVVHPREFGHWMHIYGLNIGHVWEIEKKVGSGFVKGILIS
jgi:hypothetical protein